MKSFGSLVRKARKSKKVTLDELSCVVGISTSFLSEVERDLKPALAEHRLVQLIAYLKPDPEDVREMWCQVFDKRLSSLGLDLISETTECIPVKAIAKVLENRRTLTDSEAQKILDILG